MSESRDQSYLLERTVCVAAWLVSSYLAVVKLWTRSTPLGCGAADGCGQVLSSSFADLAGVPISVFAALLYTAVLIATFATASVWSWRVLVLAACVIAGSAIWFTYLQVAVIGELCPWCLTAHALGLLLSARLLWRALRTQPLPLGHLLGLAGAALLGVALLGFLQLRAQALPTAAGGGSALAIDRHLEVLDGKLQLSLADEIMLGDAHVERVAVVMLDYACPHCRHTHGLLDTRPADVALCVLPVPLSRSCNAFAPEHMPARFQESCELARLGLAVWRAQPAAYPGFERWMFLPTTPRTAAEAKQHAVELVGEAQLTAALRDPWLDAKLKRNVAAYGAVGEGRRLPVLLTAGSPALIGRVEDTAQLSSFLARGEAR